MKPGTDLSGHRVGSRAGPVAHAIGLAGEACLLRASFLPGNDSPMARVGTITLTGQSKDRYPFTVYTWETKFRGIPAVYYITKRSERKGRRAIHAAIYVGQTNDIMRYCGRRLAAIHDGMDSSSTGSRCRKIYTLH